MKVKITFILLFIGLFVNASLTSAQQYFDFLNEIQKPHPSGGDIDISHSSEKITEVYNLHLHKVRSQSGIEGYRIRLHSESGRDAREEINKQKAVFLSKFPDVETYLRYTPPFWRLYAGNFRTKSEAYRLWMDVKTYFPNSFPIKQNINPPPLD
jgi:hypothetical protein